MKLVLVTMIRVSDRWRPVPFTQLDHQHLRLLRAELFARDEAVPAPQSAEGRKKGAAQFRRQLLHEIQDLTLERDQPLRRQLVTRRNAPRPMSVHADDLWVDQ
jgi:hypothetical protein